MITYKKGDGVKYIKPGSKLIPIIEADGWKAEKPKSEKPKPRKEKK